MGADQLVPVGDGEPVDGAGDHRAGRGEHPAVEVEVAAEQVEHGVQTAAAGRRDQQPVPVDQGRQVGGPVGGDLAADELGDGAEGDVVGDGQQRHPVPAAGLDEVLGDGSDLGLAGRQGDRAAGHDGAHEALRVGRGGAPEHAGEDQFAAVQIAPRVGQVGRHHPADLPVQLLLGREQTQARGAGGEQVTDTHPEAPNGRVAGVGAVRGLGPG